MKQYVTYTVKSANKKLFNNDLCKKQKIYYKIKDGTL